MLGLHGKERTADQGVVPKAWQEQHQNMHQRPYGCCLATKLANVVQETAAAVLPFKDEAGVKAYLLHSAQRQNILAGHGISASTAKGALGATSLLRERSFLCLHYRLDQQLQLTPCTISDM